MNKTAIIIPVHNRREVTLKCLNRLIGLQTDEWATIVVVDDGSEDGTGEAISAKYPMVTVLRGDGNLWWTGAIKIGSKFGIDHGAEFICWLNDDAIPDANTLSLLRDYVDHNPTTITVASAKIAGTETFESVGFIRNRRINAAPCSESRVDGGSGYCVFIPSRVFEQIGYPDDYRFPHYNGDVEFTYRWTRAGGKVVVLGSAIVEISKDPQQVEKISDLNLPRNLLAAARKTFVDLKSPFQLRSWGFWLITKYGPLFGALAFFAKLTKWFPQFFLAWICQVQDQPSRANFSNL